MYTTEGVFFWNRLIVACSSAVRYREGFLDGAEAGTGLMYVCVSSIAEAGGTKSPPSTETRSAPAVSMAMGRDSGVTLDEASSVSSRPDARHTWRDVFFLETETARLAVTPWRDARAVVDDRASNTVARARIAVRIVPIREENLGSGRDASRVVS